MTGPAALFRKGTIMSSFASIAFRIAAVTQGANAPRSLVEATTPALRSPVNLVAAVTRWTASRDEKTLNMLDDDISASCLAAAELVKQHGFHGLTKEAEKVIALLRR